MKVRHTSEADWQRPKSDLSGYHQSNLCGRNETQVCVRDRIDLRLIAARIKADAFQNRIASEVRRCVQREAFTSQLRQRKLDEGRFQHHRIVLQEVKSRASHSSPGFEVDQVEVRSDLDVSFGLNRT